MTCRVLKSLCRSLSPGMRGGRFLALFNVYHFHTHAGIDLQDAFRWISFGSYNRSVGQLAVYQPYQYRWWTRPRFGAVPLGSTFPFSSQLFALTVSTIKLPKAYKRLRTRIGKRKGKVERVAVWVISRTSLTSYRLGNKARKRSLYHNGLFVHEPCERPAGQPARNSPP